jgi:DNA-binding GntR family transcriptional regulator
MLSDDLEATLTTAAPGSPVASEMELARQYRVSRLTARAALNELERRHIVRRIQGRGTFVLRRLDYRIAPDGPASFTEIVTAAGGNPRTTTEKVEERVARADERRALDLPARARVIELTRRRWLEGEPVGVGCSIVPVALMPDLGKHVMDGASLYRVMVDRYDLEPRRAWWRSEVRTAPPDIARLLDLKSRADLYHNQGRLESARLGRPIEINDGWLRTDLFNVVVEIGAFR